MTRPRAYTIAAVLMLLYSLISAVLQFPDIARGASAAQAPDAPPYFLAILNFVVAILGLAAAYGVWRMQRWGVVLAIALSAINALTSLPAILFAPDPILRLLGVVGLVWAAAIIVILLRPTPQVDTA